MTVKGLEKWGDKVRECPLSNGNIIYYVNCDGLDFEVGIYLKDEDKVEAYTQVDNCLMAVLSECCRQKRRVRVWYGDRKTGESWFEEADTTGRIGHSCGEFKFPLLIPNSRSCGGSALMVGSLIRIDDIKARKTLWKVPGYYDKLELFHVKGNRLPWQVCGRSTTLACFETEEKARRWIDFQQGRRYNR
jgi:hypothetical protein